MARLRVLKSMVVQTQASRRRFLALLMTISGPFNEMQFIRLTKASHGLSSSHVANMNFASTSDYIILDAEL
jgi:hypothetical protein